MTHKVFVILIGFMASIYGVDSKIDYTELGFSINAPVFSTSSTGTVLMVFMPAKNGLSPNVNIQIQPYKDSINDYDKLTKSQLKDSSLTLISSNPVGNNEIQYEYKGKMSGRILHWLARAIKVNDSVYLITATGADDDWESCKSDLSASMLSFKLNK